MATVYSYSRFSCSNQDANESLRRQAAILDTWLKRHPEHDLDTTLVLKDCAKTAFKSKGKHLSPEDRNKLDPKERKRLDRQGTNLDPNKGDLGIFMEMAKRGEFPRGSILALEDLDRFSRTPPSVAYEAFVELVETGVRVLTLSPEVLVDQKNMNEMHVTFPIMTKMQLAYDESLKKSARLKESWAARRQAAREGKRVSLGNYPSWLKPKEDSGFEIVEDKAEIVRFIFDLSDKYGIGGHGIQRMLDGMPRFSRRQENEDFHKEWRSDSTITHLLRNKAVIGIYQPNAMKNGKWEPDGDPIHNFFPRIISDEQFYRVQLGLDRRKKQRGLAAKENNLFTGILFNEFDETFRIQYTNYWSDNGGFTPPVKAVEFMVFEFIKNLTIPIGVGSEGVLASLQSDLDETNRKICEVSKHMESASDITEYFGVLDKLQAKRRDLMGKIEYCMPHYDPSVSLKNLQMLAKQISGSPKKEVKLARLQFKAHLTELVEKIVMTAITPSKAYKQIRLDITLQQGIFGNQSHKSVFGAVRRGKLVEVTSEHKEGWLEEVIKTKDAEELKKRLSAHPKKERVRKLTKQDIERVFELHEQGMTQTEIAKLYGVTQAHISWTMKHNK